MNLKEIKTDREKLLELREEYSTLRFKIDKAVNESKYNGALRDHDYHDTWDITHPKSGKPFAANSNWFHSFGTDDDKERMDKRRREIGQAIHADGRQRCENIDKEIRKIYEKYRYLWEDLDSWPSEGRACDGESDLADLLWVVQTVMERESTGVVVINEVIWNAADVKNLHDKFHEVLTTLSGINPNITHCPFCKAYIKSF